MSLPPVPNTQIKSDNVWLGWFRRIQEILNRWIIVVGTSIVIGRFNQGTNFPALEITRSTDTAGFSILEFSNAAGIRRLEILATGTAVGYGIPANQSGLNAQTGFTLSINDTSSVFFNGQSILLERSIDNGSIIRALNPNAGTGAFSRLQASNGTASVVIDQYGTGFAGSFANQGWVYTATAQPLILGTASSERMRIEAGGNITPGADNTQTLGTATRRWNDVHATTFRDGVTGTFLTSSGTQALLASGSAWTIVSLYTLGVERLRIKQGQIRLIPLAADPGGLEDGDIWYNSTAGKFRGRAAGVTVDFH